MGNAVPLLDITKRGPCSWSPALEGPALALFWPTSSPSNEEFWWTRESLLRAPPAFSDYTYILETPSPQFHAQMASSKPPKSVLPKQTTDSVHTPGPWALRRSSGFWSGRMGWGCEWSCMY